MVGINDIENIDEVRNRIKNAIGEKDYDDILIFGSFAGGSAELTDRYKSDLDVFVLDETVEGNGPLSGIDEFGMGFDETVEVEVDGNRYEIELEILTGSSDDLRDVATVSQDVSISDNESEVYDPTAEF